MAPDRLARDLASLFERGASPVTLGEVHERAMKLARRSEQRRRPLVIVAATFGVVVLGGILIGLLTRPTQPGPASIPRPDETTSSIPSPTTSVDDSSTTTTAGAPVSSGSFIGLSSEGYPLGDRGDSSVVWTGTEMIVWGGWPTDSDDTGGAAYDPSSGTWRALAPAPLEQVYGHVAVWTGTEMIVWGGVTSSQFTNQGAAYDPATDSWRTIAQSPLEPRQGHSAVWTGSEMFIVAGFGPTPQSLMTAAAYDPESDAWRSLADSPITGGLVEFAEGQSAIWTGDSMVVYGADELAVSGEHTPAAIAALYDPATDSWTTISNPLIHPRLWHSAVWTGTEMIIWGGSGRDESGPAGVAFRPDTGTWRALPDAPVTERARHAAVWTGTHLVIWGGSPIRPGSTSERIGSGIVYDPDLDQWSTTDAPGVHSRTVAAVWTGESVTIWTGDPTGSGSFTFSRG